MQNANQNFGSSVLPASAVSTRSMFVRNLRRLLPMVFLLSALWLPAIGSRADVYEKALDRRFAEPKGSTNVAPAAVDPQLAALEKALKAEQQRREQGPPVPPPEPPISRVGLIMLVALMLAVALAFVRIVKLLNDRLQNPPLSQEAMDRMLREKLIAEEPTLVAFFNALRFGLETSEDKNTTGIPISLDQIGPQEDPDDLARRLQEFFDSAPSRIIAIRTQFSKISRATDPAAHPELLHEFFAQVDVLKRDARMRELRPIWLMTCGLQGLIQQLLMKSTSLNPSILRALAGAVGMLKALCTPGLDPALATRTPVELLAVDDNAVCLSALSMALKKAFRQPDLASEGASALALAEKKRYDAIFLDIEMPGMDGFELCTKIHETELNRNTPVVFVTSHGDFDSRAKSEIVGGQDLIAKPYLSFEITVKALTLALRARLASDADAAQSKNEDVCAVA